MLFTMRTTRGRIGIMAMTTPPKDNNNGHNTGNGTHGNNTGHYTMSGDPLSPHGGGDYVKPSLNIGTAAITPIAAFTTPAPPPTGSSAPVTTATTTTGALIARTSHDAFVVHTPVIPINGHTMAIDISTHESASAY
jgi:hypothetical protein